MDNNLNEKIDMRPKADIYEIFRKLSYKLSTALPEFIDNSISSFRQNEEFFKKHNIPKFIILHFDKSKREFMILDNAFGIEGPDMKRALKLKSPPKDTSGLNEFGMGLKTASFWLGSGLEIVTKCPKEPNAKQVRVDIEMLKNGSGEVKVENGNHSLSRTGLPHGTVIRVSDVLKNRSLKSADIRNAIASIASKYRRDIKNNGIKILAYAKEKNSLVDLNAWVNNGFKTYLEDGMNILSGEPMKYKETERLAINHPIYGSTNDGFKQKMEFEIEHLGEKLEVRGEMFIRQTGSRAEAGFDLYRRGRIIVEKYKGIITDPSGFQYQRINGYFELDNFEVTQAKDDFDWDMELQEKLSKRIRQTPEYKKLSKIASNIRFRAKNDSEQLEKATKEYKKQLDKNESIELGDLHETKAKATELKVTYSDSDVLHKVKTENGILNVYSKITTDDNREWISVEEKGDDIIVTLDVNHVFFNPFNNIKVNGSSGREFNNVMRKFAVFWALAERKAMRDNLKANAFRKELSKIIEMNGEFKDVK